MSEMIYGIHAVQALLERAPERFQEVFILKGREDKRLMPLIHALAKDPELSARAREGRIPMDELAERVRAGGGLDFTRALCRRYHDRALRLLPALHAPKEKEARLLSLLERAGRAAQPF